MIEGIKYIKFLKQCLNSAEMVPFLAQSKQALEIRGESEMEVRGPRPQKGGRLNERRCRSERDLGEG